MTRICQVTTSSELERVAMSSLLVVLGLPFTTDHDRYQNFAVKCEQELGTELLYSRLIAKVVFK